MLPQRGKGENGMALSLITNIGSLQASNALTNNQLGLNQSIAQLSSGKRIVSASDDPGGLSIAIETQGLLGALNQASQNASNASSFLQTADGALSNIGNLLQTAQQLATEAADGSYNSTQLGSIDSQYQAILTSINQIANGSSFNGISLFTGTAVTFQIGATNTANDQLAVTIAKADTTTLAVNGTSLTNQANAQAALTKVTTALATIAGDRATVGSSEQSLTAVSSNLQSTEQNLTAALSSIQDANVAQTYAKFTKESVLQQAGVQVLRQADQTPSQLVALFQ
jgi:flagellin